MVKYHLTGCGLHEYSLVFFCFFTGQCNYSLYVCTCMHIEPTNLILDYCKKNYGRNRVNNTIQLAYIWSL